MFTRGMEFDLGEDVNALRDMVHRWAQDRVKPIAAQVDRTNEFPNDLWTEMGDLGLLGITVSEEFGGSGMGYLAHVIAVEEIARASASVSLSYGAHSNLCVNQIKLNGTDEQRRKYLPDLCSGKAVGALAMSEESAGSDVVGMKLRADCGTPPVPGSLERQLGCSTVLDKACPNEIRILCSSRATWRLLV